MKTRNSVSLTALWLVVYNTPAASSQALQLKSTLEYSCYSEEDATKEDCPLYGPDGPWQAIAVTLRESVDVTIHGPVGEDTWIPVFPDGSHMSQLNSYPDDPDYESTDYPPDARWINATISCHSGPGPLPAYEAPWDGDATVTMDYRGRVCGAEIALWPRDQDGFVLANITGPSVSDLTYTIPDSESASYPGTVSRLGFGPEQRANTGRPSRPQPGILAQLKDAGDISSDSWSLHLGSAWLQQPASMVLGGYEQNRVLGDVAVFDAIGGNPRISLVDLTLDVESGLSPFNTSGSQWRGISEDDDAAEAVRKENRGPTGSIATIPHAGVPYISLPRGNCEAIADQLPVSWRESVGLYIWVIDDPRFERIINSPAYLGFTFADREARNLTIKIPFQLLNLTLEEPLVDQSDTPTRYFPCQPIDSTDTGYYYLGRAFLQGAFVGYHYDKDVAYLAQGPGPHMAQSVLRSFEDDDDDDVPQGNPADGFAESWMPFWTVLEDTTEGKPEAPTETGPKNSESSEGEKSNGRGISDGAIAGAVVGPVCALILVGLAAIFHHHRRRRRRRSPDGSEKEERRISELAASTPSAMRASYKSEAPEPQTRLELEAPGLMYEAPAPAPAPSLQLQETTTNWSSGDFASRNSYVN